MWKGGRWGKTRDGLMTADGKTTTTEKQSYLLAKLLLLLLEWKRRKLSAMLLDCENKVRQQNSTRVRCVVWNLRRRASAST